MIYVSPCIAFPSTHIPRDPCFPTHISLGMRVSLTEALVICVSLSWFSLSMAVQTALLVTTATNGKSDNTDVASLLTSFEYLECCLPTGNGS